MIKIEDNRIRNARLKERILEEEINGNLNYKELSKEFNISEDFFIVK